MPRFRFNARAAFLTYAQCPLDKNTFMEHALTVFRASYVLVCEETHADGNKHLHALLQWDRKVDTRNERYFDIDSFHPNIQACRSIRDTTRYIKKDGDWVESGSIEESTNYFNMARGMEHEEWINYCMLNKVQLGYCHLVWEMIHDSNTTTEFETKEEWIGEPLRSMTWDMLYDGKPLWIKGETGMGKTSWAKLHAPKPTLMVNQIVSLKQFKPCLHQSIIFDDMSFTHIPREAQIFILDTHNPRQIHCRNSNAQIPAGIPKIFTSNVEIFSEDPAIARRVSKRVFTRPFQ